MPTLNLTPTTTDAQLYSRYQTETSRQRVDLKLDLMDGNLSADWWGEVGPGGQSMRSFKGYDQEWSIPPLRMAPLAQLMATISDDCQLILDHSEESFDGSNYICRLDQEGHEAYHRIAEVCEGPWDSDDVYEVWDAADYYQSDPMDDIGELTVHSTDEAIAELAKSEVDEADCPLDVDDVERHLIRCRDEAREEMAGDVDDDDIEELRIAGDTARVYMCDRALDGDEAARIACAEIIAAAAAVKSEPREDS